MIFPLIRCQLLRYLRDYRLLLAFLAGPALMIFATLSWQVDFRDHRTAYSRVSHSARTTTNLERMLIPRPSSALGYLSASPRGSLGEAAIVRPHFVDAPQPRVGDRSFVFVAEAPDWGAIVVYFYSLMAVALSYDAVAGEKAGGTLRLLASRPAGRFPLILSKIVGSYLVVAGSLVVGILGGLVVISTGDVELDSWWQALLLFLAVLEILAFLLFSVLLGLSASVSASQAGAALQRALGLWAMLALVVPGAVVVLGSILHPTETESEFQRNLLLVNGRFENRLSVSSEPLQTIVDAPHLSREEKRRMVRLLQEAMRSDHEAALAERERAYAEVRREFLLRLEHQRDWIDRWSGLSPYALLRTSLDRLALGGWSGEREFLHQVAQFEPIYTAFVLEERRRYRAEAREGTPRALVSSRDGEEYELRGLTDLSFSEVSLGVEEFPLFVYRQRYEARVIRYFPDLLWMVLYVAATSAWAFWRFFRYDCR